MYELLTKFKRYCAPLVLPALMVALLGFGLALDSGEVRAATGINSQLNYQGKLTDTSGNQVSNGSWAFRFRLYDASSGGNLLWTERWTSTSTQVTTVNGIFSVSLGSISSIAGVNFNSDSLYLQVHIDANGNGTWEEAFGTRKRLTAVPYAFNADTVDGFHATNTKAVANYLPAYDSKKTLNLFDGGVSSTRATSTNLIFGGDGDNIANFNNLYVSGNNLFFDAAQLTGANGLSYWSYAFDRAITPTSTNIGLYITASSTVRDLRIDGNATTTGIFSVNEINNAANSSTATTTFQTNVTIAQGKDLQVERIYAYSPLQVRTDLSVFGSTTTTGKLLIGTANPTGPNSAGDLWVSNNATTTGNLTVDSSTFIVQADNNRVGILDLSPSQAFTVGNGDLFTIDSSGNASTTGYLNVGKANNGRALSSGDLWVSNNATTTGNFSVSTSTFIVQTGAAKEDIRIGIGTASPVGLLHLQALNSLGSYTDTAGQALTVGTVFNQQFTNESFTQPLRAFYIDTSANLAADPSTAKNIQGLYSLTTVPSGNSTALTNLTIFGASNQARHLGTGTLGGAIGEFSFVTNSGGQTVTLAVGLDTMIQNSSGVMTTAYGLRVRDITNAGTIGTTYGAYIGDITTGTQTNTPFSFYASDSNAYNYFAGNVGIGDTSPASLFTVGSGELFTVDSSGNASTTGYLNVGKANNGRSLSSGDLWVSNNATTTGNLTVDASTFIVQADTNRVGILDLTPSQSFVVGNGDLFTIDSSGNASTTGYLNIGKANNGRALSSGDLWVGNNATTTGNLTVDATTLVVQADTDRVGVGTTTPKRTLSVAGNATTYFQLAGINSGTGSSAITELQGLRTSADGDVAQIDVMNFDTTATADKSAIARILFEKGAAVNTGSIALQVRPNTAGSATTALFVEETGNIGIGDGTPSQLFTVGSGDLFTIDSSGNASTTGYLNIGKANNGRALSSGDLWVGNNATTTGNLTVDGTTLVVQADTNSVGVGTTTPDTSAGLTVEKNGTDSIYALKLFNWGTSGDYLEATNRFGTPGINLKQSSAGDSLINLYDLSGNADVLLHTAADSYFNGGDFGIGDTSPASLFTVGSGELFTIDSSGNASTTGYVQIGKTFGITPALGTGDLYVGRNATTTGNFTASSQSAFGSSLDNVSQVRFGGTLSDTSASVDGIVLIDGEVDFSSNADDGHGLYLIPLFDESGAEVSSDGYAMRINSTYSGTADAMRSYVGLNIVEETGFASEEIGLLIGTRPAGTTNYSIYNASANNVYLGTGNVGIGTAAPGSNLHVYVSDTDTATPELYIEQDSTGDAALEFAVASGVDYIMGIDNSSTGDQFMISYAASQNGGVLGTNTGLAIHGSTGNVALDSGAIDTSATGYSVVLPLAGSGNTGYGNAIGWTDSSDDRIKKNQQQLDYGIAEIMKLKPKRYNQFGATFVDGELVLTGEGFNTIGLVAQEVLDIIPEAVHPGDDTHIWSIDYNKFAPVIIRALQQQQEQIQGLLQGSSNPTAQEGQSPNVAANTLYIDQPVEVTGEVIYRAPVTYNDRLIVNQAATFYGTIVVKGEAQFEHIVVFRKDVKILGKLYVSGDQAGSAVVKANATSTQVTFDGEYGTVPKIVANLSDDSAVFVNWKIIDKTATGFTIALENTVNESVTFDWIALAIDGSLAASKTAPVINDLILSHQSVGAGVPVEFWAQVTDPDTENKDLRYRWVLSPHIGKVDGKSGIVYWQANEGDLPTENTEMTVRVIVSDGTNEVELSKTILILAGSDNKPQPGPEIANEGAEQSEPPATVLGCTNADANNFNADATQDDGSCVIEPPGTPAPAATPTTTPTT